MKKIAEKTSETAYVPLHPRIKRELKTVGLMINIYCRDHHQSHNHPCDDCQKLRAYAQLRLKHCPFQENKTSCGNCAIHCYKNDMRQKIREIMRYAGPRMIWKYPLLAIGHLFDGLRKKPSRPSKGKTSLLCLFFLVFLAGMPHVSFAETTYGCHCFNNRAFDPNDKFATDDYILATSFNSLISKSFDVPKRQIVMLKMTGNTGQDDLLIALLTAKISNQQLQEILDLRKKSSWPEILSTPTIDKVVSQNEQLQKIRDGLTPTKAGEMVANNMIAGFFKLPLTTVEKFRDFGFNEKETTLLFILAKSGKLPAETIAAQHKNEGKSWSEIANSFGITPAAAGKSIINARFKPSIP